MTILCMLGAIAILLTVTMFLSRSSMLGFPCGIFWALLGGHAYTLSTTTWDIEYFIFFSSMGMLIFSILAAYGLRTKKEELRAGDEFIDEMGKEKEDTFIDEDTKNSRGSKDNADDEDTPSRRARDIRYRADRRRERWR